MSFTFFHASFDLLWCSKGKRELISEEGCCKTNWNILTVSSLKLKGCRENTESGLLAKCNHYAEKYFDIFLQILFVKADTMHSMIEQGIVSHCTQKRFLLCVVFLIQTVVIYCHGICRDITLQVPEA